MKYCIVIKLLMLLLLDTAHAGDGAYAVSKISFNLLKNANAVLRLQEQRFEIVSTKKTIYRNHYVITILNELGASWADFSEYYDKNRSIESLEGFLYDANGRQIKKIKQKDTEDLSGVGESTLIDDSRVRRHNFYCKVYPYTIEYDFEIKQASTLFFPTWSPQAGECLSVEQSSMTMISAPDYKVRYKAFNYQAEPVVSMQKEEKVLSWNAVNLPAITTELFSPLWHELTTVVIFGPSDFQMEDYKGNMANWQDFGKFVYALKNGRDQLPEKVKQTIHALTDNSKGPKDKILLLYKYLQSSTHYISIQLGIGGWQPFDAKEVAAKGYGDCKALTNYMYSLLKEVGIPSSYALVRAGKNAKYITADFPSQQFNHVILCVPLQADTIWLECTSQTVQPGYLGDFTSDRPALLVDENGGKMVQTPRHPMNDNLQVRKINSVLAGDGTLSVKAVTRYSGLQQDVLHNLINTLSKEKVKEYLHNELDFATYNIVDFSHKQEMSNPPCISEVLDIMISNYAGVSGKRLFILPNVMTRSGRQLNNDSTRKSSIRLGYAYKDVDSVSIEIPAGYTAEALPKPVSVQTRFGSYTSSVKLTNNMLYYYRTIEHFDGNFSAETYEELVKFYELIFKADRQKVVLVKN